MARGQDLVGLTVLGLLSIRESHPYELQQFITNTRKDFLTGLPRSLYLAVERLSKAGLIEASETVRSGRRPERTIYRITEAGRDDMTTRLRMLIEQPDPDRRAFMAALSLLGCLPMPVARDALEIRRATVAAAIASLTAVLTELRLRGMPDLVVLKLEHECSIQQAELDWVTSVLARFDSGTLDWSGTVREDLLSDALNDSPTGTEE
ncbi:PadR family transcriptional regulator [Acrocarpospora catenulata]|uniref:PadR family transcriptional regulator n=1 Tax=Acrocarpospora catenulata TaxID=2836182 RepID=UPI001BDA18D8|nr:PadR family transcriptional regulator [Acrocarpospora catenulata]